jgi:hypothetical protein
MFKALIALFIICWFVEKVRNSKVWEKKEAIVAAVTNVVKEDDKTPTT